MRRINLLPPEERRRSVREGLRGGVAGILLIAGALSVMLMVAAYLFFLVRIGNEEERIAELDAQISQRNERLAELAPYRDLQARLEAKKPVADGIYRARFTWDEFLKGLQFVIPASTALDTLTAEAAPVNIQAPPDQPLSPPGAVTFTGVALPEYTNVADFVVQMNNLRYLANSQLNSAELDRETYAPEVAINFEVAAELVTEVGETGNEVRLDAPPAPESPDNAAGAQYREEQAGRGWGGR